MMVDRPRQRRVAVEPARRLLKAPMRRVLALAVLGLLAACTRTPIVADGPAAPLRGLDVREAAARAGQTNALRSGTNPSGAEIERILGQSGLAFETLDPGRHWRVVFAGRQLPRVVLYVVHGDEFTVVLGKLFTVGADAGVEFYRVIARKNYDFDQLKLSVDDKGGVFASFEVPTRILDRRELLENIFGLAGAIDAVLPELVRHATPQWPDEDEEPAPKGREGELIEALRRTLGPALATRR